MALAHVAPSRVDKRQTKGGGKNERSISKRLKTDKRRFRDVSMTFSAKRLLRRCGCHVQITKENLFIAKLFSFFFSLFESRSYEINDPASLASS